jgi:hypothetical protein
MVEFVWHEAWRHFFPALAPILIPPDLGERVAARLALEPCLCRKGWLVLCLHIVCHRLSWLDCAPDALQDGQVIRMQIDSQRYQTSTR